MREKELEELVGPLQVDREALVVNRVHLDPVEDVQQGQRLLLGLRDE